MPRTSWRESALLISIINERVCGERIPRADKGLHRRLAELLIDQPPLKNGISIGCGTGNKEMALIRAGLVASFERYELSEACISKGKAIAEQHGIADKINFHNSDGFQAQWPFDLVHWGNSLHHMLNVDAAVKWSRKMEPFSTFTSWHLLFK